MCTHVISEQMKSEVTMCELNDDGASVQQADLDFAQTLLLLSNFLLLHFLLQLCQRGIDVGHQVVGCA